MFQEKAHQTAEHKEKERKKTLTNKHETTLNFECPTGISHLQLGQPATRWGTGTALAIINTCLLYTSPSPRDVHKSRMPSSA